MRRLSQFARWKVGAALLAALCASACFAPGQQRPGHIVDRIVATVHDRVITESDWDEQERVEALLEGRAPAAHQHSQETLERLVKRVLIVEQMSSLDFKRSTAEEIDAKVADVRKQLAAQSDEDWRKTLQSYGVDPAELRQRIAEQLDMLRFIDVKFRAGVSIPQSEVQAYYERTLTPQLKAKNTAVPVLADVQDRITAVLTEQKVNALLAEWLAELEAEGAIKWMVGPKSQKQ